MHWHLLPIPRFRRRVEAAAIAVLPPTCAQGGDFMAI